MNIFEFISKVLSNDGGYFVALFAVVFVVYAAFSLNYQRKKWNEAKAWVAEHPEAAKVYYNTKLLSLGSITIDAIDDEIPRYFRDGMKIGFYVLPGTHIVESSYVHSRPGVFYRRVITTFGPSKQEITVEANKNYLYEFSKKDKVYSFKEIQNA